MSCISDPSPELIKGIQINLLRSFPVMVLSKALKSHAILEQTFCANLASKTKTD